ncbi:hypothetical protein QTG54_012982 [Skeletonema marinoi]|uniref:Uncharacterized protein n=1 Tax=Skeletonema marinoi TaxID=267567 RepID=A0AAD8XZ50_9STRA|nr:hypothetical protein QTG54_012982 [Skeletonema marinoi]
MKAHPRRQDTDRGLKFWDTHIAFEMLKEDFDRIEKGLLDPTTPKPLWESRNSYKEFPLSVFRNHYFQELRKRKESSFWRHKMKLVARKEHLAEVDKLYDEWLWNDIDGDELVKKWNENLEVNTKEENKKANSDLNRVHNKQEFWRSSRSRN